MLLLLSLGHAMYCLVDVWISCLLWMVCVLYEMYWCWYTQTHICFWVSEKNYWFSHQLIYSYILTYVWAYCSVNLQYQKRSENIAFIQLLFFIIVIISFSFLLLLMMMTNLLFLTVNSWVFIHFLILIMLVYKTTITNHTTTTNYTTTTKIYPATTMIRMKQYLYRQEFLTNN